MEITTKGDFNHIEAYFMKQRNKNNSKILNYYGQKGVDALKEATPKRTGKTSQSWEYSIGQTKNGYTINWNNTNINDHVNIAMIIQYGHGTKNGGYVEGTDYINPAIKGIFNGFLSEILKEVT